MISSGSQLTVDRDNDKNPVVSLREIADSNYFPETSARTGSFPAEIRRGRRARADTVPLIGSAGASVDADDTEVAVERMPRKSSSRAWKAWRRRKSSPKRRVIRTVPNSRSVKGPTSVRPLLLLTFLRLQCVLGSAAEIGYLAWPAGHGRALMAAGQAKLNRFAAERRASPFENALDT